VLGPIVRTIDGVNGWIGKGISWLTLILVLVTVYDVVMRYVFHAGSVAIQEAEWHLFAMNFLIAGGWTLLNDGHVRVDLLYMRFSERAKAWIDLFGSLLFCIPYCLLIIWAAWPFVIDSWSIWEYSPDPGGLPARYVLKTVIPVGFLLIGIQAVSQAIKNFLVIAGKDEKR
jgi:TRAP-type mannitol/chloroaromatic compound transport system permease small subunit